MTYTVPARRTGAVQEVLEALSDARRVVLTTHLNADGDGAGCQAATAAILRARGTEAWIVNPTPFPDRYRFLVPDPAWIVSAADEAARTLCKAADLAVVLDTGEIPRIGRVRPMIHHLPTVVVDHHPPGDRPIEGLSLVDPSACATGELIFDLVTVAGGPWTSTVVDGIYVAILTDTGSFRHSNTTPGAHAIVSALVERGARPADLHSRVYGAYPKRRLALLAAALQTVEVDDDGRLAWMTVPEDVFQDLACDPDDLEGLVDYPRGVQGVETALLFRQVKAGMTKISFRSNGAVDVNAIARTFDGGGHVKAAGAVVKGPVATVRERVVNATRTAIEATFPDQGRGGGEEPSAEE